MIMKEGYDLSITEDCSAGIPSTTPNKEEPVFIQ